MWVAQTLRAYVLYLSENFPTHTIAESGVIIVRYGRANGTATSRQIVCVLTRCARKLRWTPDSHRILDVPCFGKSVQCGSNWDKWIIYTIMWEFLVMIQVKYSNRNNDYYTLEEAELELDNTLYESYERPVGKFRLFTSLLFVSNNRLFCLGCIWYTNNKPHHIQTITKTLTLIEYWNSYCIRNKREYRFIIQMICDSESIIKCLRLDEKCDEIVSWLFTT